MGPRATGPQHHFHGPWGHARPAATLPGPLAQQAPGSGRNSGWNCSCTGARHRQKAGALPDAHRRLATRSRGRRSHGATGSPVVRSRFLSPRETTRRRRTGATRSFCREPAPRGAGTVTGCPPAPRWPCSVHVLSAISALRIPDWGRTGVRGGPRPCLAVPNTRGPPGATPPGRAPDRKGE